MNKNSNKMNITSGTIARTIILVLALVNQILTAMGHSVINISDESINTALKADEVMREGKENASRTSD